jgi:protein-tyrosine phosphatase
MSSKVVTLLFGIPFWVACSSDAPQIRAVCDNNQAGIYTVKWELSPMKSGKVKILESKNPDNFDQAVPVNEKNIAEGFSTIVRKDEQRRFFKLIFNNKCTSIIGERHIITDKIENLRDLGGYYKNKTKQVQWGKIYRSGTLCCSSNKDKTILDSLHLQTIIDLRNSPELGGDCPLYEISHVKTISLHKMPVKMLYDKIIAGQMMKGDVLVSLQDMYAQIIEEDTTSLRKIFDFLVDGKNYPLLFYCGLGKDYSGIVSMLILGALDIDREQIFNDYMLSNQYIDFQKLAIHPTDFEEESKQEALTTLLRANERVFDFVYDKIERDYGSIPNYLETKLHFAGKKREKLAEILLY